MENTTRTIMGMNDELEYDQMMHAIDIEAPKSISFVPHLMAGGEVPVNVISFSMGIKLRDVPLQRLKCARKWHVEPTAYAARF